MRVTFHGVRGSYPSSSGATARYGGNTSAVRVRAGIEEVLLDLGSGIHADVGPENGAPFHGTALVTHLHLDHVIGLPFFSPLDEVGATLDVYAPAQPGMSVAEAFERLVRPPYFPFRLDDLRGEIRLLEAPAELRVGGARVVCRPVPHVGPTLGYRIEHGGSAVVYMSDHQQPEDGTRVADSVLELCAGADLLIHDAQYTPQEFERRQEWGHSTVAYAIEVAVQADVRSLCLFHHDPDRSDDDLDRDLAAARDLARGTALSEVVAAYEGMCLEV